MDDEIDNFFADKDIDIEEENQPGYEDQNSEAGDENQKMDIEVAPKEKAKKSNKKTKKHRTKKADK